MEAFLNTFLAAVLIGLMAAVVRLLRRKRRTITYEDVCAPAKMQRYRYC